MQFLLVMGILLFGYFIFNNTQTNLEKRSIKTGFDFLTTEAGFGIVQTLVEYDETSTFGRTFVVGLLNTLLVSAVGIVLATILGFVMGIARLSNNWIVAKLAKTYVELFRNIPLLIQILFWYSILMGLPTVRQSMSFGDLFFLSNRGLYTPYPVFEEGMGLVGVTFILAIIGCKILGRWAHKRQDEMGEQFPVFYTSIAILIGLPGLTFLAMGSPMTWDIPSLRGFNFGGGLGILPEFMALLLALTIYTGSFIAEIVRSGIQAVSHGQTEAAYALGLKPGVTTRLIILPQALRIIIPPLTSQYLNLTKNSSLATAIGYPDLVAVFAGTTLNQTGQAVEIMGMTMGVYLVISLSISFLMNIYNRKVALIER